MKSRTLFGVFNKETDELVNDNVLVGDNDHDAEQSGEVSYPITGYNFQELVNEIDNRGMNDVWEVRPL